MKKIMFFFARIIYKILKKTVRFQSWGHPDVLSHLAQGGHVVVASPHFCLLSIVLYWKHRPASVVTSRSGDGDLVAALLEKEGYGLLRGSSNRGGVAALRGLVQHLKEFKTIGIACDGPKGPPLVPKPGVALCAKIPHSKVFFAYALPLNKCYIKFPSWDRFFLPLPGCKVNLVFESVAFSQGNENLFLKELESLAHLRCGHWYATNIS